MNPCAPQIKSLPRSPFKLRGVCVEEPLAHCYPPPAHWRPTTDPFPSPFWTQPRQNPNTAAPVWRIHRVTAEQEPECHLGFSTPPKRLRSAFHRTVADSLEEPAKTKAPHRYSFKLSIVVVYCSLLCESGDVTGMPSVLCGW